MSVAVLALVTDAFGGSGGIARYNRDLLSTLGEMPDQSVTVLPRHALNPVALPSAIEQKRAQANRLMYALVALYTALTREIDVVFCGHLHLVSLAWLIARLKSAKLIVQTHGIEAWKRPSRLRRAALESANVVFCVSRYTRARVLDWAAIAPERVLVIPNTVNKDFGPGWGTSLRASLGLEGKPILLTVGRMDSREQYKGQDLVIAAIPKLVADGHDVAYILVGDGDDRPRLEKRARETGVGDRVLFVGTAGPHRLAEFYRTADLFVMPSCGEGFGIAFLEAMASGTPALGLDIAGARDALADGELGTLVAAADLAEAISGVLKNGKTDPQKVAAAVRARFGDEAFAGHVRRLLQRLLVESCSSPALPKRQCC